MSFDVFLQYAQREPPLAADVVRARLHAVVQQFGGGERTEHGFFFQLPDGVHVEMFGADADGVMFALRGGAPETIPLIFAVMQATGWIAMTGSSEEALALAPIDQADVFEEFPPIRVVSSAVELGETLLGGWSDWAAYRDKVVRGSP
jgi:hypothetical protein